MGIKTILGREKSSQNKFLHFKVVDLAPILVGLWGIPTLDKGRGRRDEEISDKLQWDRTLLISRT